MKPSEQAEMKEMKMTRNYCYGDIITILYKMSVGGGGVEGGGTEIIYFFNGTLQSKNTDLTSSGTQRNIELKKIQILLMKLQNPTNTEAQDTSSVLGCEQVLFTPLFFFSLQ